MIYLLLPFLIAKLSRILALNPFSPAMSLNTPIKRFVMSS